jgi:hypothetical protein
MQDDIDALGERIHEVNARYTDRCNVIEDVAYGAQDMVTKLAMEVDELAKRVDCKADIGAVYSIEGDMLNRVDELAWEIDRLDGTIKRVKDEMPKVTIQSTSSHCFPVKNYKLKADIMAADDGKEKENMDTSKMFNFDFGPVDARIRMSPYGMAMKNADGKYVSYDKNSGNIMDVEIFNFDAQKFLYKMPVAVNAVAVGDIVVHMHKAMFVSAVNGNRISVIDIYNGEVKDIMPTTSPFGFNFITKVVSLIDMSGANTDSPFGNMLPFLLMGDNKDNNSMAMMAVAMSMTGGMNANMMSNPLMLMAMMDGKADIGTIMYLMMQNQMTNANTNCGCHCHDGGNHQ